MKMKKILLLILLIAIPVHGIYGTICGAMENDSEKLISGLICLGITISVIIFFSCAIWHNRKKKFTENKEKKFTENVENIFKTLSDEQKAEYVKKEDTYNKICTPIISTFIGLFALAFFGLWIYMCVCGNYTISIIPFCLAVGFILILLWFIHAMRKQMKQSDEVKIKIHVERLESQEEFEAKKKELL